MAAWVVTTAFAVPARWVKARDHLLGAGGSGPAQGSGLQVQVPLPKLSGHHCPRERRKEPPSRGRCVIRVSSLSCLSHEGLTSVPTPGRRAALQPAPPGRGDAVPGSLTWAESGRIKVLPGAGLRQPWARHGARALPARRSHTPDVAAAGSTKLRPAQVTNSHLLAAACAKNPRESRARGRDGSRHTVSQPPINARLSGCLSEDARLPPRVPDCALGTGRGAGLQGGEGWPDQGPEPGWPEEELQEDIQTQEEKCGRGCGHRQGGHATVPLEGARRPAVTGGKRRSWDEGSRPREGAAGTNRPFIPHRSLGMLLAKACRSRELAVPPCGVTQGAAGSAALRALRPSRGSLPVCGLLVLSCAIGVMCLCWSCAIGLAPVFPPLSTPPLPS